MSGPLPFVFLSFPAFAFFLAFFLFPLFVGEEEEPDLMGMEKKKTRGLAKMGMEMGVERDERER